jgi:hypothetical protein
MDIDKSVRFEDCTPDPPPAKIYPEYWYERHYDKPDAPPKLEINETRFYDYLANKGYRWLNLPESGLKKPLIQIINNIVEEVDIDTIIRGVYADIKALPNAINSLPNFSRADLDSLVHAKVKAKLIAMPQLNRLPEFLTPFRRDSKTAMYFFFTNAYIKVTAENIELLPYSHVLSKKPIWKSQRIKHKINIIKDDAIVKQFSFNQFLKNTCTERDDDDIENNKYDKSRYLSLLTHIGYMLHNYNDPAYLRAVIFLDASLDMAAMGGTGKSVICTAIEKLRKVTYVDGKAIDFKNQFTFQNIDNDTQVILMDDVLKKFDFEALNGCITRNFWYEKKNQKRQVFTPETNPKAVITTNYVMKAAEGTTYERRTLHMELLNYYNKEFTPATEFNQLFFNWDNNEWDIFYTLMFKACQLYLKNNGRVLPYVSTTMAYKKLLHTVGKDFCDFAEDLTDNMIKHGLEVSLPDMYDALMEALTTNERKRYNTPKFGRNLASFCTIKGYKLNKREVKITEGLGRRSVYYYTIDSPMAFA